MAACGGLEHIFEKPLSESPTFLESLSPWKHMSPIDESSFTEIFGELHFKVSCSPESSSSSSSSSSPSKHRSYYPTRRQYGQSSESFSSMNSESLSLCTEGLGFESCDDVEDLMKHDHACDHKDQWRENLARDPDTEEHHHHHHHHHHRIDDQSKVVGSSRRSRGSFPPPISCIGRSGKPWVCFKSYREDGRFILKEIRIPTQEFLHACREDGRLKLHFVQSDDEILLEDHQDEILQDDDHQNLDHLQTSY